MELSLNIISHGHQYELGAPTQVERLHYDTQAVNETLGKFQLGQFLLNNLGLNGYWTSYILLHPDQGRRSRKSSDGSPLSELESWMLDQCPIFLATQERFRIFKKLTQPLLCSSMSLASIPCGLMDDLFSLDYSNLGNVHITGVDLDRESLAHAERNFHDFNLPVSAIFELKDAWELDFNERWDLITSNGLNIYVQDDQKCTNLYKGFSVSLRNKGFLVMSFITPSSTWIPKNTDDLAFQEFLFTEVVPVKWQCVRTEATTTAQLEEAGFEIISIEYDSQRMFPAILARKA